MIPRTTTSNDGCRPTRILFVAPVAVEGGVAEVLVGLFRRADDGMYEPHVIFLRDGPVARRFSPTEATVLSAGRLRTPTALPRASARLHREIKRLRPDVIVALEPRAHLYSVVPAALQRIPALWMQHAIPGALDRFVGRLPTAGAVMNSEFIRDLSRPVTRAPLYLVRPGVDVEKFARSSADGIRERHGITTEAPLIGIVGRLQSWKGQDLFLRAAAQVTAKHDDSLFVVVGGAEMGWEDQDYPRVLPDLASRLGIARRVTFTGQTSEIAQWMAAMDIVVHASRNEPYGMVICEALAAGRPLVTVDEGGPLELVTDAQTCIMTRRDPEALADAITRLLEDQPLRERLVVNGLAHARETMSDTAMAKTFGRVLRIAGGMPTLASDGRRRVMFVAPVAVAGGANEVLLALASAKHASYEALVVVLRPGPLVRRLSAAGVDHVLMDAGQFRAPLRLARTQLQLDRLIASWRPDLVFSTEALGHLYAALPAARHGVPAVWRQPARPSARHLIDRLATLLRSRAVVVASEFIAGEQAKVGSRPIEVIRPGIDLSRLSDGDGAGLRRKLGIPAEAVLVAMIGRLQPWKGQHLFLEAAATIAAAHPLVHFAVVGGAEMGWEKGDYPGQLHDLSAKLGLDERLMFAGQSSRVQDWYAAADILVHASDHEPFGLVLCEAMLMGCAVISVDEGGPREIIDHGRTGLLVRRTADGLAKAMDELISDAARCRYLGAQARELAHRDFASERMVEQFEAFFARHARC